MSVECSKIINAMELLAPVYTAEKWDNVGLMVGNPNKTVKRVLIALDCTGCVIDEAIENNADMIITHHPFIFSGIKNIDFSTALGARIEKLIKNDIAVYSAHTNLDIADGGTNSTLAEIIGLKNVTGLIPSDVQGYHMGRCGELEIEICFDDFLKLVKNKLSAKTLAVCGNTDITVKKVGICTGAGSSFMQAAADCGCDVYITGDMKYHDGQIAEDLGLCVIDGTHYLTEVVVIDSIKKYLDKCVKGIDCIVSSVNTQTIKLM